MTEIKTLPCLTVMVKIVWWKWDEDEDEKQRLQILPFPASGVSAPTAGAMLRLAKCQIFHAEQMLKPTFTLIRNDQIFSFKPHLNIKASQNP